MEVGIESLIRPQLNDEIVGYLCDYKNELEIISKQFYIKESISKKERNDDFDTLAKKYNHIVKKRFNININFKLGNSYGVVPLFNVDDMHSSLKVSQIDAKKAYKQLHDFRTFIKGNSIEIDLKRCTINNLPESYVFPLYINLKSINKITDKQFTSIILHEIGHIFTLLEMYSNTTNSIVTLLDNIIGNNTLNDVKDTLNITSDSDDEVNGYVKIYQHIDNDVNKIKLTDGRDSDDTDVEYQADYFVSLFGLSGELITVLNDMLDVKSLTFGPIVTAVGFISILATMVPIIVLSLIFNPLLALNLVLLTTVLNIMYKLTVIVNRQTSRNPAGIEHGSIGKRYENIRTHLISLLRNNRLDKGDTRHILSQLNTVDEQITVLEKSFYDSMLAGMIDIRITKNINLSDMLSSTVDKLINNDLYIMASKLDVGIEGVKYMGKKHMVIDDLLEVVDEMLDNTILGHTTDGHKYLSKIDDVIYKHFGIPTIVIPAWIFNAGFGCLPFNFLDQSSLSDVRTSTTQLSISSIMKMGADTKFAQDLQNGLKITIDRKNNRIGGLDRKRHNSILFVEYGRDFLHMNYKESRFALRPLEIVAIILHEIGHMFTYIEAMTRSVKTNSMLQDAFIDSTNKVDIKTLEYNEEWKTSVEQQTTLGGGLTGLAKDVFKNFTAYLGQITMMSFLGNPHLVMLSGSKHELGNYSTYKTDSEILADDFAANYGMGKELTSGLKRIITMDTEGKSGTIIIFTVMNLISTIGFLYSGNKSMSKLPSMFLKILKFSLIYSALFYVARVILNDFFPYEKLPERFDSIKRSLIKQLREDDLDTESRKDITKTIEGIEDDIRSVLSSGYGSIIMSMFSSSGNMGFDFKPSKQLVDIMDKLINNDLYHKANQLEFGLESKTFLQDVSIYYTEARLPHFSIYMQKGLSLKKNVKEINNILEKYDISIEYNKSKSTIGVKTKVLSTIHSGISGFAIVSSKKDTVVSLTLEADKVEWQLSNPFIHVYNIDIVQVDELKYIYIMEMEKVTILNDLNDKRGDKLFTNFWRNLESLHNEQGIIPAEMKIDYLLDNVKVMPSEVKEQLLLLRRLINDNNEYNNIQLDMHGANVGKNIHNKYVLLDPIYNPNKLAHKRSNYIKINRDLLSKYETKAGTEHLDMVNRHIR